VCVCVLASALQYMRSKNVSHMDLKPHNILLTVSSSPSLKIAGLHHFNSNYHHCHHLYLYQSVLDYSVSAHCHFIFVLFCIIFSSVIDFFC